MFFIFISVFILFVFWFLAFGAPVVQFGRTLGCGPRGRGFKSHRAHHPNLFFFVTGKGGVGKSTLSVALANALSEKGKTIFYYPTENPSPLYEFLSPRVLKYPLDFEKEAVEYVKIKLRFFVFWFPFAKSGVFRVFSKVIPGFRELIMLGKMWYDWQKNSADFYVFDAIPMGQIISMLKIPSAGLMSGVGGFARSDFEKMADFVKKIKIIIATLPEQLPYEETCEMIDIMKKEGFSPYIIFLNKFWRRRLTPDDEKWINYILVEGKLKPRERKELSGMLKLDEFLSYSSSQFLKLYSDIAEVLTFDFFPLGINSNSMKKIEDTIRQSSLLSRPS